MNANPPLPHRVILVGRDDIEPVLEAVLSLMDVMELVPENTTTGRGRGPAAHLARAAVDFTSRDDPAYLLFKDLGALSDRFEADCGMLVGDLARATRPEWRLVAFDLDGTLTPDEGVDMLAGMAGKAGEVAALTEAAMSGDMEFADSLRRRVALLRGADASLTARVAAAIRLDPDAAAVIGALKKRGARVAAITGGFGAICRELAPRLGVDDWRANELEVVDGKLAGALRGEMIDAAGKARALRELARAIEAPMSAVAVVGDGANDIPMFREAGLSVAAGRRAVVRDQANAWLSHTGLPGLLCFLGSAD